MSSNPDFHRRPHRHFLRLGGRIRSFPNLILLAFGIAAAGWLTLFSACNSPESSDPSQRQIGYAFYSSLDSVGDSVLRRDAVSHSLLELIGRTQPDSRFNWILPSLPPTNLQRAVCMAPDPYWTQSSMFLIITETERKRTMGSGIDSVPFRWHPWCRINYIEDRPTNQEGQVANPVMLNLNLLLARNLEPLGADDGAFNIWISETVLGSSAAHTAIRIYGDSSLYERCIALYKGIVADPPKTSFATSHTYSNLHDHQLWFFPDPEANEGSHAKALLEPLAVGIQQTRQPVKMRLVLTGIDACHRDFLDNLVGLQLTAEADLKVILADSDKVSTQAALRLNKLKPGTCRLWTGGDTLHPLPLASRFLLIDGPYVERENEPAAPARLSFFLGDDLIQSQQRKQVAIWTRVDNKRVFTLAEQHWNRLWEMSETLDPATPNHFKRAPNCKPPRPK